MARKTPDPRSLREKKCRKCLLRHPRTHFPYGKRLCRSCHTAAYARRWWRSNRERNRKDSLRRYHRDKCPRRRRAYNLKARYGITAAEFWALFKSQGNKCAVCRRKLREATAVVDHEHGTSPVVVRGILCRFCNTAIGYVQESAVVLRAMIRYIERRRRRKRRAGLGHRSKRSDGDD